MLSLSKHEGGALASSALRRYHAAMKRAAIILAIIGLLIQPALADTDAERCIELPAPVAATKQAIQAAAKSGDYDALAKLADPETFTYSFGDGGDPAGHWKTMATEGTDAAAIMLQLFDMPCALFEISGDTTYYEWPVAAEFAYEFLTPEEIAALEKLYDGKLGDWYVDGTETGYYVGWRLLITKDGCWNAFVAGD